jgi:hypothetical protein
MTNKREMAEIIFFVRAMLKPKPNEMMVTASIQKFIF